MIRRGFIGALALLLAVGLLVVLPGGGLAQQKVAKIGLSFPLTGADADSADAIVKGAQMAIDEINQKGGAGGYKLEAVVYDSATPAAKESVAAVSRGAASTRRREAWWFPMPDRHTRPRRPLPSVCSSAVTHNRPGSPARACASASALVEPRRSKARRR